MTDPRDPAPDARPDPSGPRDDFEPFADDSRVIVLSDGRGELSLENGLDAVRLHGDLDLAADAAGLANTRALREALERVEALIEARLREADGG